MTLKIASVAKTATWTVVNLILKALSIKKDFKKNAN